MKYLTTFPFDLPRSAEQRTGFLIALTHQLTRKGLHEALRPLGIEARHFGLLTAIAAHGGLSQARLMELLGLDKSVVVLIVDDLERLGLAERRGNPTDRRAHAIHITKKGRKRTKAAQRTAEQLGRTVFAGLSPRDRKQFDELLKQIIMNCQRTGRESRT